MFILPDMHRVEHSFARHELLKGRIVYRRVDGRIELYKCVEHSLYYKTLNHKWTPSELCETSFAEAEWYVGI